MILDSQEVILRMVEKGLGVAGRAASDDLHLISLTCLPFGDPPLARQVVLLERIHCNWLPLFRTLFGLPPALQIAELEKLVTNARCCRDKGISIDEPVSPE